LKTIVVPSGTAATNALSAADASLTPVASIDVGTATRPVVAVANAVGLGVAVGAGRGVFAGGGVVPTSDLGVAVGARRGVGAGEAVGTAVGVAVGTTVGVGVNVRMVRRSGPVGGVGTGVAIGGVGDAPARTSKAAVVSIGSGVVPASWAPDA
jgi:hypothetical protein